MRWKRTWNANSQDKYAGGSVIKNAINNSSSILSRATIGPPAKFNWNCILLETDSGPFIGGGPLMARFSMVGR